MAERNNHLSTQPPRLASMDFSLLLTEGIAYCQRLGSQQWTDYNEHDPGVTILEQLCYAISDIGYRIDFPVPDVLAEQPQLTDAGNSPLYTGDQILTCNPLTIDDFRKLLIDVALSEKYANFKNIWLKPVADAVAGPAGLYQLQMEVYDPGLDNAALIDTITSTFLSYRNLNEDMQAEVEVLGILDVVPDTTIELDVGADPDTVLAEVLFLVQDALVPFVRIESIAQLLQQGIAPDRIYVGPLLQSGAIADTWLLPKKTAITLSDVGNAIRRAAGVRSIAELTLKVGGVIVPPDGSVAVQPNQVPRLMPSLFTTQTAAGFKLTSQGVPLTVDPIQVGKLLAKMLADIAGSENYTPDNLLANDYVTLPQGEKRDIARYYSIQRQFPQTYGIGEYGVKIGQPQTENDVKNAVARQAQARQLKAYLLFFEQMLSDCQKQLACSARLLSLETDLDRSYFCQSLVDPDDGPPNMVELLRPPASPPAPPTPPAPPVDDTRYVVYVFENDAQATPLLRSREFNQQSAAATAEAQILALGAEYGNYRVRDLPGVQFQILLDQGRAAFGCQRFAVKEEAEAGALHLAMFIDELACDPRLRERCMRIEVSGKYVLRLLDDEGAIILSAERLTASGWEQRRQQMLGCGLSSANYRKEEISGRRWRLRLMDERRQQLLADGDQRFESEQDADQAILATVALFQQMCGDPSLQARHFMRLPPGPIPPIPPIPPPPDNDPRVRAYLAGLERLVHEFDPYPLRRNRFLDHLLARFGEQFDDRALRQVDPRPATGEDLFERDLIGWKNNLLRNYVLKPPLEHPVEERSEWLGGGRSRGFNQAVDFFDSSNRTGLELRMTLLLGLPGHPSTAAFHTAVGGDAAAVRAQLPQPDAAYVFSSTDPAIFQRLMRYGTDPACYRLAPPDVDGVSKVLFQWPGAKSADQIFTAAGPAEGQRAIANLIAYLKAAPRQDRLIYGGEQMHVVEHILLRTDPPLVRFAEKQPAPDFYAFRVSVFFPAKPTRFQSPTFRAFAQQIAQQNCPAHIDVRCYWLPAELMATFLKIYTTWANLYQQGPTSNLKQKAAAALAEFIDTDVDPVPMLRGLDQ